MDDTVTANTVDKLSQRGCSAGSQVSQLPSAVPQQIDHAQCIQYTTGEDNYYNYCLWPYRPITSPTGKFQPVTLLLHSFEVAGLDSRAGKIVQQLQQEIGTFQTVYGIKWAEGRIGWEYYFYDYQRRKRSVSITRVLQALQPLVNSPIRVNESLPYFMFSLDFDEAVVTGERDLDVVHMYVGNPGSSVSSGIAYAVSADSTILENFYFFFDAQKHVRQAAEKIYCSAHVDAAAIDIDRILWPELKRCQTLCVANKRQNDTIYFSGVDVEQLLFFLNALNYPGVLIDFVDENRARLDHLLYDVGFDYVTEGNNVRIVKSGYYGIF